MAKFQGKYRGQSIRLQNWDYGWDAAYFITICTHDRVFYFGNVKEGKMKLSPIGAIADVLWHEIKHHAKNVELGAFVVMPNHIHGILILDGNRRGARAADGNGNGNVRPRHALAQRGQQRFQNQGKNTLSSIIGSYKSAVTRHARRLGFDFAWQPKFYEHIIRNDAAHRRIATYIQNNPAKWRDDKFHPKNPKKNG